MNTFYRHTYVLFFVLLLSTSAFAQTKTQVTGTVKDSKKTPLTGATVETKISKQVVSAERDGSFSIEASPNDTLVVKYMGYKTKEEIINNRSVIEIILEDDATSLNEVVVVGYGEQKKANLTGAVATISSESLANRQVTNVSSALAGLASGVQVRQNSGQPGQDHSNITIRGTGSFNTEVGPLVIVDGIIGTLDAVNPNDIENISLLKDASAAAIYGAQAANGVVLVTTKRGKIGKPLVNYSGIASVSNLAKHVPYVSDYVQYMGLINQASANVGIAAQYTQEAIDQWTYANANPDELNEFGIPNYVAYPNTDWYDVLFKPLVMQTHNISVSGATDNINYLMSTRVTDNPGMMDNSGIRRYEVRANLEAKVNNFLTLGTQTFASVQNTDPGSTEVGTLFGYIAQASPSVYPFYDGRYGGPSSISAESAQENNLQQLIDGPAGFGQETRISSTLYAKLNILEGLTFEPRINYQARIAELTGYTLPYDKWDFSTNTIIAAAATPDITTTSQETNKNYRLTYDNVLRYNKTFGGKHSFGALIGHNETYYNYYEYEATQQGLLSIDVNNIGAATTMTSILGDQYDNSMRSFFGRVDYVYDDKYIFQGNLRRDGSSRFGPERRWGTFPSVGAAWVLSKEAFFEPLTTVFQFFKLSGSWGRVGVDASEGNYDWQSLYRTVNYSIGGEQVAGIRSDKIGNDILQWELTTSTDVALQFTSLKNKLSTELRYYNRTSNDILTVPPIPATSGTVEGPTLNTADMRNRGIELNLGWRDQIGELKYSVNGNFSINRNIVTNYRGNFTEGYVTDADGNTVWQNNLSDVAMDPNSTTQVIQGYGYNEYYLRQVYAGSGTYFNNDGQVNVNGGPADGMIRTPEDLAWVQAMQAAGYTFSPLNQVSAGQLYYGDLLYADLNGDGIYGDADDRYFTGDRAEAVYNFGLNLSLQWRNFDLSMIWGGQAGMKYYWLQTGSNSSAVTRTDAISTTIAENAYYYNVNNPNDPANNINGSYPRLRLGADPVNSVASDFWLYDASYLKLRNLQFGYSFPQNMLNKIKLNTLRVFFTGENLLIFTKYPGGDPEIGANIAYPSLRQFSFGVNIGL